MKPERPSRTAQFVALGRAIADTGISHVSGFRDPIARLFLNERGKRSLAKVEQALHSGKRSMRLEMARGMADIMALRTVAIDQAVHDALVHGAKQVVILGAGYDGRAWRMSDMSGVSVFEIDHPATQSDKRSKITELPTPVGNVHFVSIDFERESLDTVLQRAGHNPALATCWIWEGVVMYLTHDAMRATLANVARSSAAGSTLIVNYHTAHRRFFGRLIFRLIGEPQISASTPAEMAADLRSVGFRVVEDSGMLDWNRQFARGEARVERSSYMRIAVARIGA